MKNYKKIVLSFDLDFTLIDNREGIINSFNYALKKYKLPPVDKIKIEKMIGTPLDLIFAAFSKKLSPSKLSTAFREYYSSKGIYQVKLFPGVSNKLEEFRKHSIVLGIITSKKQEMAVKLLKYLEIDIYFDYIIGETDNIKSKTDPKLKSYLFNKYPDYKFIIIGDHPSDRKLAEMLSYPFIGVLTGNHTEKELREDIELKMLILNNVNELTIEKIYSLF